MDDVVIVGGGIIGAATAYFLSMEGRKVKVIERDPTYKTASFPLSLGGFRRQFFQKENILLGKFAKEFIFSIPELLKTEKNPNPTASMVPNGYLLMFGPEHAEEQYRALENHKACDAGTKNIKGSELSNKTLGIIGFGNVAIRLSNLVKGFDMNILTYSKSLASRQEKFPDIKNVSFDELITTSDIISFHCKATPDGKPLINKEHYKK